MLSDSLSTAKLDMGQTKHVRVLLIFGLITVSIPYSENLNVTSNKLVEEEVRLLCEELEDESYNQGRSFWKLWLLPVKKVLRQANMSKESGKDHEQLQKLLTKSWIDDKFDKQLRKLEKEKMLEIQNPLQVNTLVVIDKYLNNMVFNSIQFVTDFYLLVNHLLGSIRIKINISDILLEDSRSFGFIDPFDKRGSVTFKPAPDFLSELQKRSCSFNVIMFMTSLNICDPTKSTDHCSISGIASNEVSKFPICKTHSCKIGAAIVEVQSLYDPLEKWQSAAIAAHELIHLMGAYQHGHDGENDYVLGGPGGRDCRKDNGYLMAPIGHPQLFRYRVCKNKELWSRCTKKQVEHFTSNWDNVCPRRSSVNESQSTVSDSQSTVNESQSTVNESQYNGNESSAAKSLDEHTFLWCEYILCGCLIVIIVFGLAYGGVLVYNQKKRGSYKLSDSEGKENEMITGVSYNRILTL